VPDSERAVLAEAQGGEGGDELRAEGYSG